MKMLFYTLYPVLIIGFVASAAIGFSKLNSPKKSVIIFSVASIITGAFFGFLYLGVYIAFTIKFSLIFIALFLILNAVGFYIGKSIKHQPKN